MTNKQRIRMTIAQAIAAANDNRPRKLGPRGDLVAVGARWTDGDVLLNSVCSAPLPEDDWVKLKGQIILTLKGLTPVQIADLQAGQIVVVLFCKKCKCTFYVTVSALKHAIYGPEFWELFNISTRYRYEPAFCEMIVKEAIKAPKRP